MLPKSGIIWLLTKCIEFFLAVDKGEFYCPKCVILRALHRLLHGNLNTVLGLNPIFIVSFPYFCYWLIFDLLKHFNRQLYQINHQNKQLCAIAFVVII